LVLSFAACCAEPSQAALARLDLPELSHLLQRLRPQAADSGDEFSLSTPHERAQARAMGLPATDGLIPLAAAQAVAQGLNPDGAWAWITPCHLQVGRDQISLLDPQTLALTEAEMDALGSALQDFFEDDGVKLQARLPGRWLASGDLFKDLPTASLDRVIGRDVGIWMPPSVQARALRRLQSETQMLLYNHPLTEARLASGLRAVNSFWVSGTGTLPPQWQAPPVAPELNQSLRASALQEDWATWAQTWQALDAGTLAQWRHRAESGEALRISLCGEKSTQTFETGPRGLIQTLRGLLRPTPARTRLQSL
jgi:hypothetical protein